MRKFIEVETIQHIKDTQRDAQDQPRDVISEALAEWNAYAGHTSKVHDRIWQDYRYRMIGSCDVDKWVTILGDRLAALSEVYVGRLDMQQSVAAEIGGTVTDTYGERTDDTTYGERTDSSDNINEDMPNTSTPITSAYLYPDGRNRSEAVKGEQEDSFTKGEQIDTHEDGRSSAERLNEYYKNLRDPLDGLMRDIADLWLNMW